MGENVADTVDQFSHECFGSKVNLSLGGPLESNSQLRKEKSVQKCLNGTGKTKSESKSESQSGT